MNQWLWLMNICRYIYKYALKNTTTFYMHWASLAKNIHAFIYWYHGIKVSSCLIIVSFVLYAKSIDFNTKKAEPNVTMRTTECMTSLQWWTSKLTSRQDVILHSYFCCQWKRHERLRPIPSMCFYNWLQHRILWVVIISLTISLIQVPDKNHL